MRMISAAFVLILSVTAFATGPGCNFEKTILKFEKRMDMVATMKGAKVYKELASEPDESSRIQKYSKPIKSGQYMGLRQYAVYGFVGCDLLMVRMGKINPKTGDIAAEATVYLRDDGNLKASCKGSGSVLRVNPLNSSIMLGNYELEPNQDCICYDENSIERAPSKKTGCAEKEDFDRNAVTLSREYLDFADPDEKKVEADPGSSVQFDEKESYLSENSTGTRKPKTLFSVAKKKAGELPSIVGEGEPDKGKVTVLLKVADTGEVVSSMVASSTMMDRGIAERIKEAVAGWDFGKSGKGDVMVYLVFRVSLPK